MTHVPDWDSLTDDARRRYEEIALRALDVAAALGTPRIIDKELVIRWAMLIAAWGPWLTDPDVVERAVRGHCAESTRLIGPVDLLDRAHRIMVADAGDVTAAAAPRSSASYCGAYGDDECSWLATLRGVQDMIKDTDIAGLQHLFGLPPTHFFSSLVFPVRFPADSRCEQCEGLIPENYLSFWQTGIGSKHQICLRCLSGRTWELQRDRKPGCKY